MRLAKAADGLGYTRYWVAEHHNVRSVAATSPAAPAGPVASTVLRGPIGRGERDVDAFGDHLDDVIALLSAAGVSVQLSDRDYVLRSTPQPLTTPRVFVLGSSLHSARIAAAKGLPYVFGHHLFGEQTAEDRKSVV